jgi:hypothetical protein
VSENEAPRGLAADHGTDKLLLNCPSDTQVELTAKKDRYPRVHFKDLKIAAELTGEDYFMRKLPGLTFCNTSGIHQNSELCYSV